MLELSLVLLYITGANAALTFGPYYKDHMVLQRGPQQAVVWGYARKIGDTVSVSVSGYEAVKTTIVREIGKRKAMWKVKLPAITETGPFTVTATSGEGTVVISDVLFGDVWLCSGQSNMGFPVRDALNGTREAANSEQYQDIRIMKVGRVFKWSTPTPVAVGSFSAVCWFFGEYIHQY